MEKFLRIAVSYMLVFFALGFVACSDGDDGTEIPKTPIINNPDPEPEPDNNEPEDEIKAFEDSSPYAHFFAYNVMSDVYLWNEEIAASLNSWNTEITNAINKGQSLSDPVAKVNTIRYKDGKGKDIDRWSMLTDDYESFIGGVNGVATTTYGCEYNLFLRQSNSNLVVAFVIYVYPDSPAEKAGLNRGDMILTIDGKDLTTANYSDLYYSSSMELGLGTIENRKYELTGETVSMTAVNMYENPVFMSKVFDCGGKKVGYLVYHSFTLDSCNDLIEACKYFKQEGVTELVLDLRYNGGGYVITENLLASMFAPQASVSAKDIYQTEIWNASYMAYYKEKGEDLNTYFETKYSFKDHNGKQHSYSTADANIGLDKIYVLVTSGTASASESIIVGLLPYMDVEIIGEQTHGKYTTGSMVEATGWYQGIVDTYKALSKENPDKYGTFDVEFPWFAKWKTYADNWGIYVMINRYADKDGNTPCMPDGFTPDEEVYDRYDEPYPLGDEREALLRAALVKAGKTDLEARSVSSRAASLPLGKALKVDSRHPLDGKRIVIGLDKTRKPMALK